MVGFQNCLPGKILELRYMRINEGSNEIGDEGLYVLSNFNNLHYLSVWNNEITQKGLGDFL